MRICILGDSNSIHIKKYVDYINYNSDYCMIISYSSTNITDCKNYFPIGNGKIKINGFNISYLKYIFNIASLIINNDIEYLNCHYSYSYGFIGAIIKLFNPKIRLSIVCHGSDVLIPRYMKLTKLINRFVFSIADKIIAVSEQIADQLYYKYSNKVKCIQYGVEEELLFYANDNKDIDVISTRAFVQNSNNEILLQALNSIQNTAIMNIRFYLPGISEDKINSLREKYQRISINSAINHELLMHEVARSKIFLSGAISDGASLSLLEAMALGAFPVVYNNFSNRSWIIDGINGFLFRNTEELKVKLSIAIIDSQLRNYAKNINKEIIYRKCIYQQNIKEIYKFIYN